MLNVSYLKMRKNLSSLAFVKILFIYFSYDLTVVRSPLEFCCKKTGRTCTKKYRITAINDYVTFHLAYIIRNTIKYGGSFSPYFFPHYQTAGLNSVFRSRMHNSSEKFENNESNTQNWLDLTVILKWAEWLKNWAPKHCVFAVWFSLKQDNGYCYVYVKEMVNLASYKLCVWQLSNRVSPSQNTNQIERILKFKSNAFASP